MKEQVLTLRFAYRGSIWCRVTNGSINANGLQFPFNGAPWWGHGGEAVLPGHLESINGIPWANVEGYQQATKAHILTALEIDA